MKISLLFTFAITLLIILVVLSSAKWEEFGIANKQVSLAPSPNATSKAVGLDPTASTKTTTTIRKSSFYNVKTYSDAYINAQVGNVDAVVASHYAYRVCNYLYGKGQGFTSQLNLMSQGNMHGLRQSASYLDTYRKTFCTAGVDTSQSKLYADEQNDLLEAAHRSHDKNYLQLIDIQTELVSGEAVAPEQLNSLVNIISATDSPATFIEAGNLLASYGGNEWGMGRDYIHGTAQEENLALARQGAVALAYCHIYNICAANSIVSVSACIPNNCSQGAGFTHIVQSNMTPEQFRVASLIAQDIVNLRKK